MHPPMNYWIKYVALQSIRFIIVRIRKLNSPFPHHDQGHLAVQYHPKKERWFEEREQGSFQLCIYNVLNQTVMTYMNVIV